MEEELVCSQKMLGNLTSSVKSYMDKDFLPTHLTHNNCTIALSDSYLHEIQWLHIKKIGYSETELQYVASEIKNILLSVCVPGESELVFLVQGDGATISIYLGIRDYLDSQIDFTSLSDSNFAVGVKTYIESVWPGSKISLLNRGEEPVIPKYEHCYSLTGIPSKSFSGSYAKEASIDKLLGVLSQKPFSYLITAKPISSRRVDSMIESCLDAGSMVETIKQLSLSASKTKQKTEQVTISEGRSDFESQVDSYGTSTGISIRGVTSNVTQGHADNKGFAKNKGTSHSSGTGDSLGHTATWTVINKRAVNVAKNIDKLVERLEIGKGGGLWDVGVMVLTNDETIGKSSSLVMRALTSGEKSYVEPIKIHNLSELLGHDKMLTAICHASMPIVQISQESEEFVYNPLEHRNIQLSSLLTTEELTSLINFPQRSIMGFSVAKYTPDFSMTLPNVMADNSANAISVGKLLNGEDISSAEVSIPVNTLNRHVLVSGTTGGGKTNTVINILKGFASQGKPFMVIEPAKTEYVDWAITYNREHPDNPIKIIMPGDFLEYKGLSIKDKLYINPFEVICIHKKQYRLLSHIDRIKSVFATAFPMQDILPTIMENLIYAVYDIDKYSSEEQFVNWFNPEAPHYQEHFPTLQTMKSRVDGVIRDLGYDSDTNKNLKGCMHTRLNSLTKGWKNDVLNNSSQATDWVSLFNTPCVINLSGIGDDVDRAFIMSLLLQYLYEFRAEESSTIEDFSFNDNQCRHLVIIEEAHRIMSNCVNPEMPQYKSGQMISNLLSEIAAYGQGVMIVDQIPVRLIPDAIKNTNLKIIHKLVSSDDISAIGDSIGLTEDQKNMIPRLRVGQALISGLNLTSDVYLAQINKTK